eukprot:gene8687-biopygen7643
MAEKVIAKAHCQGCPLSCQSCTWLPEWALLRVRRCHRVNGVKAKLLGLMQRVRGSARPSRGKVRGREGHAGFGGSRRITEASWWIMDGHGGLSVSFMDGHGGVTDGHGGITEGHEGIHKPHGGHGIRQNVRLHVSCPDYVDRTLQICATARHQAGARSDFSTISA